jgi:hypothetical protein
MAAGHEGRLFFMPYLHELDLVVSAAESRNNAVDAVTRISENALDAPLL